MSSHILKQLTTYTEQEVHLCNVLETLQEKERILIIFKHQSYSQSTPQYRKPVEKYTTLSGLSVRLISFSIQTSYSEQIYLKNIQ